MAVLYQICLLKYFLTVCALSSHSFDSVLYRREVFFFLILMTFNLSIFVSWIVPLVLYLKSHQQVQEHLDFFPILPSKSFTALQSAWRSMIQFELVFMKSLSSGCRFIFLHVIVQLFKHHLWKESLYSTVTPLFLCQKSVDCIYRGLYSGSLFYSIDLFVYSFTNSTLSFCHCCLLCPLLEYIIYARHTTALRGRCSDTGNSIKNHETDCVWVSNFSVQTFNLLKRLSRFLRESFFV